MDEVLLKDIFGDDDDDDDNEGEIKSRGGNTNTAEDEMWGDSDEDTPKPLKKQTAKPQTIKPQTAKPQTDSFNEIFGSDDDEEIERGTTPSQPKKVAKRKRNAELTKKKPNKLAKAKELRKEKKSGDITNHQGDSGDEYDSGDEIVRTKDDDEFIDEEDDQHEITKEYDEDNQNFNDKPPEQEGRKKKKSEGSQKRASKAPAEASSSNSKDDLVAAAQAALKKTKKIDISDAEKNNLVTDLIRKMQQANTKDEEMISLGQPAICKLQLLPGVQRAVGMKDLHYTLLEADFLSRLREWIEPKLNGEILPSLQVRSAIYDMLGVLPCQPDHLKRSGVGQTVMMLRKHKDETIANKKVLRELVEKWCRPLFGKSIDPRSSSSILVGSDELKEAAALQRFGNVNPNFTSRPQVAVKFDSLLRAGASDVEAADARARVRTPYNNGYVFTVR
jgi:transcription factor SPN1